MVSAVDRLFDQYSTPWFLLAILYDEFEAILSETVALVVGRGPSQGRHAPRTGMISHMDQAFVLVAPRAGSLRGHGEFTIGPSRVAVLLPP